jgi:hypothetical protein
VEAVMATTTAAAIRNTVSGLIRDITPAIHSRQSFRQHRHELPHRDWAEANPAACLRTYSARFLGSTEPPAVNDTLVQEVRDVLEITIAYPTDWRHGGGPNGQLLGLDDVITDDARLIERYVGPPGYATLAGLIAPATVMWEAANEREAAGPVTFSVLRYRVDYFRSLS